MMLAASTQVMWFVTRGSGAVSLIFITASIVLGIVTRVEADSKRWPRFVTEGLHRSISLASLIFLAIHILTTVADGFVPIGIVDAVVPFHSTYRTWWLGLGTIAFDLLVALSLTSIIRARLGYRVWRFVHWAAYACWPLAIAHGLGIGSDSTETWLLVVAGASALAVGLAIAWRVRHWLQGEHAARWVRVIPLDPPDVRTPARSAR